MTSGGDLNNMWDEAAQGIANIVPGKSLHLGFVLVVKSWRATRKLCD